MTNPTTPGAPVPPDELKVEWLSILTPGPVICMDAPLDAAAAWGYAQAMQERQELAVLLRRSIKIAEAWAFECSPSTAALNQLDRHADQARAAVERLRGGGSDG